MALLKKEGYDAFVSAGNTGACVAASTFVLGMIPGVDRPGIGCIMPSLKNFTFVIDCGANTAAKPEHLLQYAKMAKTKALKTLSGNNSPSAMSSLGRKQQPLRLLKPAQRLKYPPAMSR